MKSKITANTISKLAVASLAIAGFGLNAQTISTTTNNATQYANNTTAIYISINELPSNNTTLPTYYVGNGSATYAESVASSTLNTTTLSANTTQINALSANFTAALNMLNGSASTLGSAANVAAAQAFVNANPGNITGIENLAVRSQLYNQAVTTVNTFAPLITVANGTGYATWTSNGTVGGNVTVPAGIGSVQNTLNTAINNTANITNAINVYKMGAGNASVTLSNLTGANLEANVIVPLRAITTYNSTQDSDNNGFLDVDETAHTTALGNFTTQQANVTAVISNVSSTISDIADAIGNYTVAQAALSGAVNTLYTGFSPMTEIAKENALGTVLNGSWERDAILSATTDILTLEGNVTDLSNNVTAINGNITAINGNITSINANVTAINGNISSINTSVTNLSNNVTALNANVTAINANVTALNANVTAINSNVTALNANVTALNALTSDNTVGNIALGNRATALETRATNVEGRATALETLTNNTTIGNVALGNRATALETRATNVEGRATVLEALTGNLTIGNAALGVRTTALEGNVTNLSSNVAALNATKASRTMTYAQSVASPSLNVTTLSANTSTFTNLQNVFNSSITNLNGSQGTAGSAANVTAAYVAYTANSTTLSNTTLASAFQRAFDKYTQLTNTVGNLRPLVTVANNTTHATFQNNSTVGTTTVTAGLGSVATSLNATSGLSSNVATAMNLYKIGAGNSTVTLSNLTAANLENVIVPLSAATAYNTTQDANGDGFLDTQAAAVAAANTTYSNALASFTATLANSTATNADVSANYTALAAAEAALANAVNTLYAGFSPLTEAAKENALNTVLNGAWERNAIFSATTDILALEALTSNTTIGNAALGSRATALEGRATVLEGKVAVLQGDVAKIRQGVAMSAALQTPVIGHGKNNAVKLGVAVFDGETGIAGGYARRVNEEVSVNIEFASTSDFDETIVRGGINYTW